MKFLRFIFFVLKNGSLKSRPLDFEKRREEILKSVPSKQNKKSLYTAWRTRLATARYTGSLVAALAYVKNAKTMHKQYFIADALQLGYVRIFKAGSTSVLRQLLPHMDVNLNISGLSDKQIDELSNRYFRTHRNDKQKGYEYFTIVRNPFHRIVSVYLDLFDPQNSFFSYQDYLFGILKKEMTFMQFLHAIYYIPDALKSMHFISQFHIVKLCGGKQKIKCFCIERELLSLKCFLHNYDLNFDLTNKHKVEYDYRTYYNAQTVELVYAMYKMDIEEFDYKEEYRSLVDFVSINAPIRPH